MKLISSDYALNVQDAFRPSESDPQAKCIIVTRSPKISGKIPVPFTKRQIAFNIPLPFLSRVAIIGLYDDARKGAETLTHCRVANKNDLIGGAIMACAYAQKLQAKPENEKASCDEGELLHNSITMIQNFENVYGREDSKKIIAATQTLFAA